MGKWLPIISRVVTKTIFGEDPDRHWNVVQNNGMLNRFFFANPSLNFESIFVEYRVVFYLSCKKCDGTERSL